MPDPTELTHEQLGWMLSCGSGAAPPSDPELLWCEGGAA